MLWSGRYEMEFKELLPIASALPAESTTALALREIGRETFRITLLANYGAKDKIQGNENIVRLGTYIAHSNILEGGEVRLTLAVKDNGDIQVSLITSAGEIRLEEDK